MNPRTLLVAAASAVFAAGLTYWAVSARSVRSATVVSQVSPANPPLVISPAGPEPAPPAEPVESVKVPVFVKPSPTGSPIAAPPRTPAPAPPAAAIEEPVKAPVAQPEPAAAPAPAVAPPPPSATNPAPPQRTALSPPKEVDRPAESASLRDTSPRAPNTVTINQGTLLNVRIGETLSVQKNLTGDTFFATLEAPLVADGFVLAEKGARVEGKIIEVDKAGKMSGTSRMSLELTQINTSDGQRLQLQTSTYTKDGADRNKKNDAAKIGGGAVLGAIIGAAAGGGKGAAVGAGAGGAAGTGAVLLSGGRNLTIPVETKLSFRIEKPITITERVMQ